MWLLLGTTITASFFDSLNPSAIAQQMLLQAMVKQKRHTLYFILGIGTANLAMGLAIYYGIAAWAPALAACAVRDGRRFLRCGIDERVPVFRLHRNAFGLCAAVSACSAFYTSV